MMRRVQDRRDDLPVQAEINVTSLVDVAFTLLVIFIITAPVLQGGIEVSVPEADVQPLQAEDHPFYVSVEADGTVYIENTAVTIEDFRSGFPQLMAAGSVERVYVRGDSVASWGRMLQVISTIAASGVNWAAIGVPWIEE